ncbi:MAG: methylated-DNA--[protein]-cysteine S-methyltransferase [Actinobacteria bacterium]|nr:methylated-DNA--[protein]-cysteine S-methyltransferase [Actinomycetota bacterium]
MSNATEKLGTETPSPPQTLAAISNTISNGTAPDAALGTAPDAALDGASANHTAVADEECTIRYRTADTPIGTLLLAVSERGVHHIGLRREDHEHSLELLAREVSPRLVEDQAAAGVVLRQLDEYFAGARTAFDVACDLSLVHGFGRRVVEALAHIPYGERWSYGAVAEAVGHPRAARAVGTACGNNPIPLIFPCHRVVRSDGSIGRYGGGEDVKAALLELEAKRGLAAR